jgi:hypothetical protein
MLEDIERLDSCEVFLLDFLHSFVEGRIIIGQKVLIGSMTVYQFRTIWFSSAHLILII